MERAAKRDGIKLSSALHDPLLVHDIVHASIWRPVERLDLVDDDSLEKEVQRIRLENEKTEGAIERPHHDVFASAPLGANIRTSNSGGDASWQRAVIAPLLDHPLLTPRGALEAAAEYRSQMYQDVAIPAPRSPVASAIPTLQADKTDNDVELEALLRGFLIKAHLADEDTNTAFTRFASGVTLPDRVVTSALLPCPLRMKQTIVSIDEMGDATSGFVWDSSSLIVEWLTCTPEARSLFVDSTVLELGAGAGLVSIFLALIGASRVVLTDGSLSACDAARSNVALNHVTDKVHVAKLRWGEGAEFAAHADEALRELSSGGLCAQTIIGSDVLYEPENIDMYEATLRSLIARGGCSHVVVGWRDRGWDEMAFLSRLSDLGDAQTVWTALPEGAVDVETRKDTSEGVRNKGVSVLTVRGSSPTSLVT